MKSAEQMQSKWVVNFATNKLLWGRERIELDGERAEWGWILTSELGHAARHGGLQICANKIARVDFMRPIGGPTPFPQGEGQASPSPEESVMAAVALVGCSGCHLSTPVPLPPRQFRIGLSNPVDTC